MTVQGMEHFTVLAEDLEATRAFYGELLGLEEGYRPPLGFPGAWLYAGGRAVLHIIAGRGLPESRAGVLDHMAFAASDLAGTLAKLERRGLDYTLRRQAETRVWQLFFHDPNGAKVELDFAPEEEAPGR
ncbi:MAG TPA: VOC family protein [Stellaceae bacterium]|nr:VOC family protein [Stellaceae bacterium]